MADAKLGIKVGAVSFEGEGAQEWLAHQLDKILAKLPELQKVHSGSETHPADATQKEEKQAPDKKVTLAAFLKEKKATSNQVRKFLATAVWLHDMEGKDRLTTGDIVKALDDHKQGKLTNPSQSLNNNATKGDILKGNKDFYVTDEGREELK